MALTRSNLETLIVGRLGPLMEVAGLAVTTAGSNADLACPMAWAVRTVGGSTADVTTVTDAEVNAIPVASYDDLLDLAEYRTLQNVVGNLALVDITTGPRSEKLSQTVIQAQAMLTTMGATIQSLLYPATAGYISLDISEHNE